MLQKGNFEGQRGRNERGLQHSSHQIWNGTKASWRQECDYLTSDVENLQTPYQKWPVVSGFVQRRDGQLKSQFSAWFRSMPQV